MPASRNKMQIELELLDKVTKRLQKIRNNIEKASNDSKKIVEKNNKSMQGSFVELAAKTAVFAVAIRQATFAVNSLVQAANRTQQLKVRLRALFDDTAVGVKIFEDMNELAGKVPQAYDDILESATNLAAVVKGGASEINQLMPIILDISAATGLTVQETTSQIIRMYSAGAAAADLFRERGITAALGFQAGVSVSNKETIDRIIEQWEDGSSKYAGATELLAETWEGRVSMMRDAWFQFRSELGEVIILSPAVQGGLELITETLRNMTEQLDHLKGSTSETLILMSQFAQNPFAGIATFIGEALIATEDMEESFSMATENMTEGLRELADQIEDYVSNQPLSEEMEKLREATRLLREEDLIGLGDTTQEVFARMKKDAIQLNNSLQKAFANPLSGFISGSKSAKEAIQDLGKSLIKIIADYIAQTIVSVTIGQALMKVAVAASAAQAAILASAWAPAATLASIATGGGSAITGTAAVVAGMGAVSAAAAASSSTGLLGAGLEAGKSAGFLSNLADAIPKFAEGGIVSRPTLAVVGERGPEAIVPLNEGGRMGNTFNITINEPRISGRDDIGDLAEELGFEIGQRLRVAG